MTLWAYRLCAALVSHPDSLKTWGAAIWMPDLDIQVTSVPLNGII